MSQRLLLIFILSPQRPVRSSTDVHVRRESVRIYLSREGANAFRNILPLQLDDYRNRNVVPDDPIPLSCLLC